jgi:hypothetical protein
LRQALLELCLELAGTCRANGNIHVIPQYLGCVAANRLLATVFRKVVHAFCTRRVVQHLGGASPGSILPVILRRALALPGAGREIYGLRRSHPGAAEIQSDESITAFAWLGAIN